MGFMNEQLENLEHEAKVIDERNAFLLKVQYI
jgi:hypothetical protein